MMGVDSTDENVKRSVIDQMPNQIRQVYHAATCLYRKEEVDAALDRMAFEIHQLLEHKNPLLLCVMVGGLIPAGHLLTRIDFPLELDYVHATRYCGGTKGGELQWRNEPSASLKGRTVLIIDDILDEGITLQQIVNYCEQQGANKVYTAVLVDKRNARVAKGLPEADIVGLQVDNLFVFGYGMDYQEYLRNAPGIYAVSEKHKQTRSESST